MSAKGSSSFVKGHNIARSRPQPPYQKHRTVAAAAAVEGKATAIAIVEKTTVVSVEDSAAVAVAVAATEENSTAIDYSVRDDLSGHSFAASLGTRRNSGDSTAVPLKATEKRVLSNTKKSVNVLTKTFFSFDDDDDTSIGSVNSVNMAVFRVNDTTNESESVVNASYDNNNSSRSSSSNRGCDLPHLPRWKLSAERLLEERGRRVVHTHYDPILENDPFYRENTFFDATFSRTLEREFEDHFKNRRNLPSYMVTKLGRRDGSGRRVQINHIPSPFDDRPPS